MVDVPNLPGVPPLASYGANNIGLIAADSLVAIAGTLFGVALWGIFQEGVAIPGLTGVIATALSYIPLPVLEYDNQTEFDFHKNWHIASYPVEGGSFVSYDKVETAGEIRVQITAGGNALNRLLMLQTVQSIMGSTNLFAILTPEGVYLNYNPIHWDQDRRAENVGLVTVNLFFQEVMQTATAQFQSTSTPVVAGQSGGGLQSTSTVPPNVSTGLGGLQ